MNGWGLMLVVSVMVLALGVTLERGRDAWEFGSQK